MKKIAGIGNVIIAGFFIFMTSISVLLPSFTLAESIQDYLVHILFFLLISGITGLVASNNTILYTSFGCAAALALFLKSASNNELKNPIATNEDKFIMAHINLSVVTDVNEVRKIFSEPEVDAVSVQEYTPDWAIIMPGILDTAFKFSHQNVRMDLYGKAIFSKYPIKVIDNLYFDDIPNINIEIVKKNKVYRILSTYLTPALDNVSKVKAKTQFNLLQEKIMQNAKNLIVSGEFNQVYWSHDVLSFRNKTGLLNSRRNVNPSKFKMPYDHIFYSSDMECFKFAEINDNQGNHIGSKASFQIKISGAKRKY